MQRRGMAGGVALLVAAGGLATGGCRDGAESTAPARCGGAATTTGPVAGYRGVLLDAHVTPVVPGLAARTVCVMGAHEVEHAALGAPMDPDDTFVTESAYRQAVEGHEAAFLPFMVVESPTRARLERVLTEVGLFFRGVWVDDPAGVPGEVFDLAAERDLFVAAPHATASVVAAHPPTKVLVSADEPADGLADLLRSHPNVFVTVEAPEVADYDRWFPILQAGPGRVMWGSGVGGVDDTTPAAYGRVVSDTRAFIARLPQPMRTPFAVGNARRLLGVPSPPQPDA